MFVSINTIEDFYMCKRKYKNEHAFNHNTFIYFHLCPAACGLCVCVCVCELVGGLYNGNNYGCALSTSVLTERDLTVIGMHGS